MAEEHRCQAPQLCANNCGFFGSPATQNLCSKCYRDLQLKEQQSSSAKLVLNQSLAPSSSSTTSQPSLSSPEPVAVAVAVPSPSVEADLAHAMEEQKIASSAQLQLKPNRCMTCRRRVGLTGFNCRCGLTFCGSHRYPEQHGCEFDFKGMDREQIAKANRVVEAEKLEKISIVDLLWSRKEKWQKIVISVVWVSSSPSGFATV